MIVKGKFQIFGLGKNNYVFVGGFFDVYVIKFDLKNIELYLFFEQFFFFLFVKVL